MLGPENINKLGEHRGDDNHIPIMSKRQLPDNRKPHFAATLHKISPRQSATVFSLASKINAGATGTS